MAASFGQVLLELARQEPRICGVSCDCWGFVAPLAREFPERAVEMGIAEQNLIGVAAGLALRAAELLAARGIAVRVLDMHTIKPLDREAVLRAARETRLILTLEEHTIVAGLGGAVAEALAEAGTGAPLVRLGLRDEFAVMSGSRQDFWNYCGIAAEAVAGEILDRL